MPDLKRKRVVDAAARGRHYDDSLPGFGLYVGASGARSYFLEYRPGRGRHVAKRRISIGRHGALNGDGVPWTPNTARDRALGLLAAVKAGRDPLAERDAVQPPEAERLFRARAGSYLADPRRKRQKTPLRAATIAEYRRALMTYASPLHNKPLEEISRRDVAELLGQIKAERGAVTAMRTRAALGRLFTWAIAQGFVENSPVLHTEGWATPKRERELSDAEIRALWQATAEPTDYHRIVRLILWTGCRPSEAAGMTWSELENGTWTFTAERAKNGRPLALPLPRQAGAELAEVPRREGRDLLFGFGPNGFRGWSKAKRELDALIARNNAEVRLGRELAEEEEPEEVDAMTSWQLRDIRRTVETRLASVGVRQEIINRVLNHAQGPITATYNRYEYLEEKREALQKWADALETITGSRAPAADNVVELARRA